MGLLAADLRDERLVGVDCCSGKRGAVASVGGFLGALEPADRDDRALTGGTTPRPHARNQPTSACRVTSTGVA